MSASAPIDWPGVTRRIAYGRAQRVDQNPDQDCATAPGVIQDRSHERGEASRARVAACLPLARGVGKLRCLGH
jgi:hypothetical protein